MPYWSSRVGSAPATAPETSSSPQQQPFVHSSKSLSKKPSKSRSQKGITIEVSIAMADTSRKLTGHTNSSNDVAHVALFCQLHFLTLILLCSL
jgi:hypothetical protein